MERGFSSFAKEIGMRPRSFEDKKRRFYFVDQQPVRFYMAFTSAGIVAHERVIAKVGFELFLGNQGSRNRIELLQVLTALSGPLEVFLGTAS